MISESNFDSQNSQNKKIDVLGFRLIWVQTFQVSFLLIIFYFVVFAVGHRVPKCSSIAEMIGEEKKPARYQLSSKAKMFQFIND